MSTKPRPTRGRHRPEYVARMIAIAHPEPPFMAPLTLLALLRKGER